MDPIRFYGLDIPNESEDDDELAGDDLDDQDYEPSGNSTRRRNVIIYPSDSDEDSSDEGEQASVDPLAAGPSRSQTKRKNIPVRLNWQDKSLDYNEADCAFLGDQNIPQEIKDLDTPLQFFLYLFTPDTIEYITQEMCRYSEQTRGSALGMTGKELEKFIGVLIYMSIMHFPTTRHYWNSCSSFTPISNAMTCNRFEELKRFLHFTNNEDTVPINDPNYDKLQRIRPLINKIHERLLLLPREEYLAIDEQVIPTKARSTLKNYNPKKPHKWGYKAFVLSGASGLTYDFELYAGAQSNVVLEGQTDLGVSSNVAMRLSSSIPQNMNYKLFFDNWYTSLQLMAELHKKGILPLGTVNRKRLPNHDLPNAGQMTKKGRGFSVEKVVEVEDVDISVVTWLDNKVVNFASTYVGKYPEGEVQRFSRKKKIFETVPCPKAVLIYNRYMGGVDLLDSMLGYYRIKVRSKKWYHKIFFHMIDLTCVNSWILWRKTHEQYMPLLDFKLLLAEALTRANQAFYTPTRNRGRPAAEEPKRKRKRRIDLPLPEIANDGLDHLPAYTHERQLCKMYGCSGKSYIKCEKCNIHLCLNKDRNCFKSFHLTE